MSEKKDTEQRKTGSQPQAPRAEFSIVGNGGTAGNVQIDKLVRSQNYVSVPPGTSIDPSIAALIAGVSGAQSHAVFNVIGPGGNAAALKVVEQHDVGALAVEVRNQLVEQSEDDSNREMLTQTNSIL